MWKVNEIKDKNIWENFLLSCKEKTFLSSWNWGEFQTRMGNKIWRLGIYDEEQLNGVASVSKIKAKRGTFLLIQHGPDIREGKTENKEQILEVLLGELKKIAAEEKAIFIRMNPLWERNQENQKILRSLGFRESPMHANAYEATWKLDLTPAEEEILIKMRKTTRYLIRQAMKNQDIAVEKSEKPDNIGAYQKLNTEVARRQKFVPFSLEYVKNEFEIFSKDNQALLFFGRYKGELVAAALVVFWQGIGFYHQAASDAKYAKLSLPYLILWEAVKEAKKRGCILYDFWGYVDPKKESRHPWAGPTLFKVGFGGRASEYVKTQDFPLSKKYWLTFIFEKLRKIRRGL
ncbi:MAG: peptidoglycan bridge formation glycyltransferase FemA/FemB family protein [Candidatus Pacebacteria bacterium]|nr:peptidoglycan bridge formation glycyltransferase FemA/FemB family protein [Candidatus Paceibacterota bacterium]